MTNPTAPQDTRIEALAEALRAAGVEIGSVGGDQFRRVVAARLLASDWLSSHIGDRERAAWQQGYDTCEADFGESADDDDVTTPNPYRIEGES